MEVGDAIVEDAEEGGMSRFGGGVAGAVERVPGGDAEVDPLDTVGEELREESWDGGTENGLIA